MTTAAAGEPFRLPDDFEPPVGGLNRRQSDDRWTQDERALRFKLPAAQAFARANALDRTVVAPEGRKRIAFVAAGKAFNDLREAFVMLGLDAAELSRLGVGVRKIALVWPLEDVANAEFLRGFEEVVAIEEKRAVIESQLDALTRHWPASHRPRCCGKRDPQGRTLLPEHGEIGPLAVASAVLERLAANALLTAAQIAAIAARLPNRRVEQPGRSGPLRVPHFCAGCPHARSTRLPEGSRALAGIGCHSMALWVPDSHTATLTQMGGEGANWIGAAGYVDTPHVFQNLGDGTYSHSGLLAIRAAKAAGVSITYKILLNQAVAMTGGQPVEGAPDAARIAWQLHAEGVERIAIVTGRAATSPGSARDLPAGTLVADRDDLDAVMQALREHRGVSAIVYDQICATEKRRLIRRGARFAGEPVVTINERICEGCGDCSEKSHCSAVRRIETPFGPKRRIDASSCNTDLSCTDGFCPSFVTIERAAPSRVAAVPLPQAALAALPEPERAALPAGRPFGIVMAGAGGSGLVTAGSVIAAAAALDALAVTQLDNTGLARKGGEVTTHLRIGGDPGLALATRIPEGCADLLIAGDLASAASPGVVARLSAGARAVVSSEALPMLDQAIDPDLLLPVADYRQRVEGRLGSEAVATIDAQAIAQRALGDTLYANLILVGAAAQAGRLPVGCAAIEQAIRAHGVSVEENLNAFAWGRLAAADPGWLARLLSGEAPAALADVDATDVDAIGLDAVVEFFATELERYQNRRLADRYRALVHAVRDAEQALPGAPVGLARAVASHAFDALAAKDEYEVARLASDPRFLAELRARYGARARPVFHFAPTWLGRHATRDGRRGKIAVGPWIVVVLRALAALKFLRGSRFDPFARQSERIAQRRFTDRYCAGLARIAASLRPDNLDAALEFARLPGNVRGYGHVRMPKLDAALQAAERLWPSFEAGSLKPAQGTRR